MNNKRNAHSLHKPIVVFCEGQTEYHYLNGYRKHHSFSFAIKMVDVRGGGYKKMRAKVIQSAADGVLARVVLLDLDRYHDDVSEQEELDRLIQMVHNQNKRGNPVFLILSNPDFDDFVLLHEPSYSISSKSRSLQSVGYESISELKADESIYERFNRSQRGIDHALGRLNPNTAVKNEFSYKPNGFLLRNTLKVNRDFFAYRTSNIVDLFNLLQKLSGSK